MEVLNFLSADGEFFQHDTDYPNGPVPDVSFLPSGDTDAKPTAAQQSAYKAHIQKVVASNVGMKLLEYMLNEDVYQKGSFKAVFLAGGPGSGKSGVIDAIFNTPKPRAIKSLTTSGMKVVNSDQAYEYLKKKHNIPTAADDMTDDQRSLDGKLMYKSVQIAKKQLENYLDGKLGVIIDGTGGSSKSLLTKKKKIEELGYDTYMIFVHTSLETALERNRNRKERSLLDKVVERSWDKVQNNLETYRSAFGRNFTFVSTEKTKPGELPPGAKSALMNFISEPVKDKAALKWIDKAKKVIK